MKTGLFALVAVSLLQLTASQPRAHRHHHPARQVVVTNVNYVTVYDVVTRTLYGDPASAAAPPPPPASSPSYAPLPSSSPAASPSAPSGPGSPGPSRMGITYTPKKKDGGCKTQDQINSDFEQISSYGIVRIYDTGCNQVSMVLSAAKSKGVKLFVGIPDLSQVTSDVRTIIDAAKNDWDSIHTVAVGNELIHKNSASADAIVGALDVARGLLKGAGYTGSVVTVDTVRSHQENPQLCARSDYCAINCHAFFDPHADAAGAGKFVDMQSKTIANAHPDKRIMITESGWPSAGSSHDNAVPSVANQQAAIASLKSQFSGDLILFSAFNEPYKKDDAYTHGVERFWGILGDSNH